MNNRKEITDLERQVEYLISDADKGKVPQVIRGIESIRGLKRSILRRGREIPKELEERTHEGYLKTLESETYLNFVTSEFEKLKLKSDQMELNKINGRVVELKNYSKNLSTAARPIMEERLDTFMDGCYYKECMEELTDSENPDLSVVRKYANMIEDDGLRKSLEDNIAIYIQTNVSSTPRFKNEAYDKTVQNLVNTKQTNRTYKGTLRIYDRALETQSSTEPESSKFVGFIREYVSNLLNEYMDSLEKKAAEKRDLRGLTSVFRDVLLPAVEKNLIDGDRVREIHETYFPRLSIKMDSTS